MVLLQRQRKKVRTLSDVIILKFTIMAKERQPKVEIPQKADRYAKYLTAPQAADYIGVSNNYLYKLTAGHKVPFYNPTGRKLLFKRTELDAWVEAARVPTDDELIGRVQTEQIKKGGLL